jgi:ribosomal protein S8
MNEETENQLSEFMKKEGYIKKSDVIEHEHKHEEPKHNHATRSFDKFCPDCQEPNPDYKEPEYFCTDCLKPIGTKEDVEKAKVCYKYTKPKTTKKKEGF